MVFFLIMIGNIWLYIGAVVKISHIFWTCDKKSNIVDWYASVCFFFIRVLETLRETWRGKVKSIRIFFARCTKKDLLQGKIKFCHNIGGWLKNCLIFNSYGEKFICHATKEQFKPEELNDRKGQWVEKKGPHMMVHYVVPIWGYQQSHKF